MKIAEIDIRPEGDMALKGILICLIASMNKKNSLIMIIMVNCEIAGMALF